MKKKQEVAQSTKQAQIVDQNYANNILFMAMSTMETLANKLRNSKGTHNYSLRSDKKEFGAYDVHDYSYKQYEELRSQLIQHVMLLAHSRKGFDSVYGTGAYSLPSNYNAQMVIHRLKQFMAIFYQVGDKECQKLANDMLNIIADNKTKQLNYEKMKVNDPYENSSSKKQNLSSLIGSKIKMQKEGERVINEYNKNPGVSQGFKSNPNYVNPNKKTTAKEQQPTKAGKIIKKGGPNSKE